MSRLANVFKPLPPLPPASTTAAALEPYDSNGGGATSPIHSSLRAVLSFDMSPSPTSTAAAATAYAASPPPPLHADSHADKHDDGDDVLPSSTSTESLSAVPTARGAKDPAAVERQLVRTAAKILGKTVRTAAKQATPTTAVVASDRVLDVRHRVADTLTGLLHRAVADPADPALDRDLLRRAFQLTALLNAVSILRSLDRCAEVPTTLRVLEMHLDRLAHGAHDASPMPPAPLLNYGQNGAGERERLVAALARFHDSWAAPSDGLARSVAAAVLHDVETMLAAAGGVATSPRSTDSLDEHPSPASERHGLLHGGPAPVAKPARRKGSLRGSLDNVAVKDPASSDVLDLVAQHNRQLDNQRFTMTPRKEDQVELTTLMAAIERSGQKRMDEQRSDSPNELRERRLSQVEAIVERQQQRSLTDQRYELTPERLARMTVNELVHFVVDMNRMGYEDQTAASPETRRRRMLDGVADIVERMQQSSLDDQRFVEAMAEKLEISADSLRSAVSPGGPAA